MTTPSLNDNLLDSRDIEKRIGHLLIGNDFIDDNVDADQLREFLAGDHTYGNGGERLADHAGEEDLKECSEISDLEDRAEFLDVAMPDVLKAGGMHDGVDAAIWFESLGHNEVGEALVKMHDFIIATNPGLKKWIEYCEEFGIDYAIEFDYAIHDRDELEELADWVDLREQVNQYSSEWNHGAQIIANRHFEAAMRQRCEETSDIGNNDMAKYIDWEAYAEDQKSDYVEIDVGDYEFYVITN